MLVSFSVKNFLSFKEKTTFTMVGTSERQHSDRVPVAKKFRLKILPIAAIYGGNASGKSNFVKALTFVQNFVVQGLAPELSIARSPFRLDERMIDEPTEFEFSLLIKDRLYEYSFAIDSTVVLSEKLQEVNTSSRKVLFQRNAKDIQLVSFKNNEILEFVAQGTRQNILFLTNSVWQKIEIFKPVYDWFRNSLQIITPKSRFLPVDQLLNESNPLSQSMSKMLRRLDTGIDHLEGQSVDLDMVLHDEKEKESLLSFIQDDQSVTYRHNSQIYVITKQKGRLTAKRLTASHVNSDGQAVLFGLHEESDGNNRLINLIPAFFQLTNSRSDDVFIFDELDRSLHPILTRTLIENFLSVCQPESRAQIIFTTHDISLMDQDIFRRDELWVTERNRYGESRLYSFSDYEGLRKDKNIRKAYMEGRLGGLPNILGSCFGSVDWSVVYG